MFTIVIIDLNKVLFLRFENYLFSEALAPALALPLSENKFRSNPLPRCM